MLCDLITLFYLKFYVEAIAVVVDLTGVWLGLGAYSLEIDGLLSLPLPLFWGGLAWAGLALDGTPRQRRRSGSISSSAPSNNLSISTI